MVNLQPETSELEIQCDHTEFTFIQWSNLFQNEKSFRRADFERRNNAQPGRLSRTEASLQRFQGGEHYRQDRVTQNGFPFPKNVLHFPQKRFALFQLCRGSYPRLWSGRASALGIEFGRETRQSDRI